MAQKLLSGLHVSGSTQIDFMPTHESEGIITLGRYDANTSRYHNIKSYVSSTQASNYLKFSLHGGTANTVADVLTLKGDLSATFADVIKMPNNKGVTWTGGSVRVESSVLKLVGDSGIQLQDSTTITGGMVLPEEQCNSLWNNMTRRKTLIKDY